MSREELFGYPEYNSEGEMVLTTYTNSYKAMNMDIRVYKLERGEVRTFVSSNEETAVLLLNGGITFEVKSSKMKATRQSVFVDGPYAIHAPKEVQISVCADEVSEILVQKTHNDNLFDWCFYTPQDAPWHYSAQGKYGNVANRRVNTIIDHDIEPVSNMVLGEVLNDPGNWSGYLPHRHPQPECYYFLFDHPEGFGASFVGDEVFKSTNRSFSAIPGGMLHPQAVAPGYQMYTVWMIRHIDNNPWLQTDRCEDEAYTWLNEAKFDAENNAFIK